MWKVDVFIGTETLLSRQNLIADSVLVRYICSFDDTRLMVSQVWRLYVVYNRRILVCIPFVCAIPRLIVVLIIDHLHAGCFHYRLWRYAPML